MQKLCFEAEYTIPEYRTSGKSFAMNASNPTYYTEDNVLECFGAFRKSSASKTMQNQCFRAERNILVYRAFEKSFATNKSNIIDSIQNDVWEYFRGFCEPSARKIMQNQCFEPESTISGYRTSEKTFTTNISNLTYQTQNDVWECFGAFRRPSA